MDAINHLLPPPAPSRLAPRIIFVGRRDAGTARAAAALATALGGGRVQAESAGLELTRDANIEPAVEAALAEVGATLAVGPARGASVDLLRTADLVVAVGCGDGLPRLPGLDARGWSVDDEPTSG